MNLKQYPIWKQAVQDFRNSSLAYGDTLTREWLMAHFELEDPQTVAAYREFEIKFLNNFYQFRDKLLEEYNMDLRNIHGTGNYVIVHPREQTVLAMGDFKHAFKRLMGKTLRRVTHVDHGQLTDSERKENTDAISKLMGFQSLTSEKKWLT